MDNEKIFKTFVEENSTIAKNIFQILKNLQDNSSENDFNTILENLRIIKSNAHILDFLWIEKVCNGFEEIIIAILTKNLIFTTLLNDFLLELTQQIIKNIETLEISNEESKKNLEKWVVDCDRIAAGMILESNSPKSAENITIENIQEKAQHIISNEQLEQMLQSFEGISIQRARLKQQSVLLGSYDSVGGIEYTRLRKNITSTIKDLENLLKTVQEQLLEVGMITINETLNEFKRNQYSEDCKIEIEETDLMMDKNIAPHLLKILVLFLNNSKEYGFKDIKNPKVTVAVKKNGDLIEVTFKDNGNGINLEELRQNVISTFPQRKKEILEMDDNALGMFLFASGMTPVETGLNAAWKEIEKIKGKLKIHTAVGEGTAFTVSFPKSLSSETGFIVKYGNSKYFIPSNYVVESVSKSNKELITDTPKPYFEHRNQKIRIYRFSSILPENNLEITNTNQDINTILIIEYLELKFGLVVDDLIGFSSKSVRPVPCQLKGIQEVEGIVIDENYDIIPVLNVPSLIKRFTWLREYDLKRTEVAARKVVKNLLIADPSVFARHIIRSIYENHGFYVEEAKDGIEALEILKKKKISLIISAVEMPRMNGLTLLNNVQRSQENKNIPVILFPFEAEEELEKSYLAMGAKFVIKKNNFDRNELLEITDGIND